MNLTTTKQNFYFSIEDTQEKCYRDVISELLLHGWNKTTTYKKKSKLEKKK